ncbi:MAG: DUF4250 domain-containing protein [Oscillospiraceae bacterium]|nr:DUF4250 domain-containing protein [Oscillospiraceae bacterium]
MLPADPVMLLSYINTQLRDKYKSLDDLSEDMDVNADDIKSKLAAIDYTYDPELNKFI